MEDKMKNKEAKELTVSGSIEEFVDGKWVKLIDFKNMPLSEFKK